MSLPTNLTIDAAPPINMFKNEYDNQEMKVLIVKLSVLVILVVIFGAEFIYGAHF